MATIGVDHRYDLRKLLTNDLLNKEQWADLAEVVSQVFFQYIYNDIHGLLNLQDRQVLQLRSETEPFRNQYIEDGRQINQIELRTDEQVDQYDRNLLIAAAKNRGFDYFADSFTNDDYLRLLDTYGLFLEEKSPESFVDYISYVKNTRIELEQLWTSDYITFIPEDRIPPGATKIENENQISDDPQPQYYPTPHVNLTYNATFFQVDRDEIIGLFRLIAPINLVLEQLIQLLELQLGIGVQSAIERVYTSTYRAFEALPISR